MPRIPDSVRQGPGRGRRRLPGGAGLITTPRRRQPGASRSGVLQDAGFGSSRTAGKRRRSAGWLPQRSVLQKVATLAERRGPDRGREIDLINTPTAGGARWLGDSRGPSPADPVHTRSGPSRGAAISAAARGEPQVLSCGDPPRPLRAMSVLARVLPPLSLCRRAGNPRKTCPDLRCAGCRLGARSENFAIGRERPCPCAENPANCGEQLHRMKVAKAEVRVDLNSG